MNVMHDSHDDVEVKPGSWVKKPVLAARLRTSITRLPIPSVGSRIGSSALFSSPSASVHVSFTLVDAFLSAPGCRLAARTIAAGSFHFSVLPSAPLPSRARTGGEPGSGAAAGAAAAALMNAWNAAICTTSGCVTSSARCACSAAARSCSALLPPALKSERGRGGSFGRPNLNALSWFAVCSADCSSSKSFSVRTTPAVGAVSAETATRNADVGLVDSTGSTATWYVVWADGSGTPSAAPKSEAMSARLILVLRRAAAVGVGDGARFRAEGAPLAR